MSETTTRETSYYADRKHPFESMPNISVSCRWCGHGTAYYLHCNVPAFQPEPDADGLSKLESDVVQTAIAYHCHREDGDAKFLFHEACSALIEARYQFVKAQESLT